MSNANLLQRIQYLLSADERADISSCWNVAKIDNTYISIDERFQQLKDDQSTYLNEYADTKSGRLSKQFLDMLKWSKSHDI